MRALLPWRRSRILDSIKLGNCLFGVFGPPFLLDRCGPGMENLTGFLCLSSSDGSRNRLFMLENSGVPSPRECILREALRTVRERRGFFMEEVRCLNTRQSLSQQVMERRSRPPSQSAWLPRVARSTLRLGAVTYEWEILSVRRRQRGPTGRGGTRGDAPGLTALPGKTFHSGTMLQKAE